MSNNNSRAAKVIANVLFSTRSSGDGEGGGGGEGGPFSRCMEGMRKEAERSSWLNSVVMTHSLAGGTGSGLGSGLLQVSRRVCCLSPLSPCIYISYGVCTSILAHTLSAGRFSKLFRLLRDEERVPASQYQKNDDAFFRNALDEILSNGSRPPFVFGTGAFLAPEKNRA